MMKQLAVYSRSYRPKPLEAIVGAVGSKFAPIRTMQGLGGTVIMQPIHQTHDIIGAQTI